MTTKLVINADANGPQISKHIYGHFSEHLGRCIYDGLYVGEDSPIPNTRGIRNDIVDALKKIAIPNLRWPGGCFADEYHWKDGIGPKEDRPCMVNTHWGMVTENNHFGTHEFMDLCEQLDCEPFICGNVGSGTVHEMQQWVEYLTFDGKNPMADIRQANGRQDPWKVKFWEVGNENWGCGGHMRPEYYADLYRRYATYCRNYGGNKLYKIACGPNGANYEWTDVLMREAGGMMDGLDLHYYCGNHGGPARDFDAQGWFHLMKRAWYTDELLTRHSTIMDKYDPDKRVALVVAEWGTWHKVEPGTNPRFLYQQSTLLDALVAGISLNLFNNHAERVRITNIAQTINVLQAMVLTEGEKMLLTPTYHVFEMFVPHHDATLISAEIDSPKYVMGDEELPAVSVSASCKDDGSVFATLCNLDHATAHNVAMDIRGAEFSTATARILTDDDMHAFNDFDATDRIKPADYDGVRLAGGTATIKMPAKSVVAITLKQ